MSVTLHELSLEGRGTFEFAESGTRSGRCVLMLHGYLDSWYSFNGVMLSMPDGYRVLSLSQRGHGNSPKPETGYAIGDFAADAIAFLDALGVEQAAIVGHSMGSFIAQEMALRRPQLVSALVLIGTGVTGNTELLAGFNQETALMTDPVKRAVAHEFQAGTCANPLGTGMTLERIVDETELVPARVWHQALAGLVQYRPATLEADLSAIHSPTLLIWGDKDEIFLREQQDALLAILPDARLEVVAGAGHGTHWEYPGHCANLIVDFCASSRKGGG